MKNTKLSVRNQTRFKKSFLLSREETILKKALELSVLCENEICVIHYDREGNLVNTYPEDQCQVKDIVQRYNSLSEREKLKKNTNLSQFLNKKLVDEKRKALTDAEERKKLGKKVGEFKGSLQDKLHILHDRVRHLLYSQDQSPCLDVTSEQNHNDFSSSQIEEDPLMNYSPHDLDQQQSFTDLLMSGDDHQSKFSVFLFNHETATFTQLPNSVSSSYGQGFTGTSTSY
ncbi:hypothetical protein N665_1303s0002 [Sinapis alba]|nr:hypothetical protein N665_1303s0002 [Sinapis alba]